jgi:hypothetical protein
LIASYKRAAFPKIFLSFIEQFGISTWWQLGLRFNESTGGGQEFLLQTHHNNRAQPFESRAASRNQNNIPQLERICAWIWRALCTCPLLIISSLLAGRTHL